MGGARYGLDPDCEQGIASIHQHRTADCPLDAISGQGRKMLQTACWSLIRTSPPFLVLTTSCYLVAKNGRFVGSGFPTPFVCTELSV